MALFSSQPQKLLSVYLELNRQFNRPWFTQMNSIILYNANLDAGTLMQIVLVLLCHECIHHEGNPILGLTVTSLSK